MFVLDCSVAIAWCLSDESSEYAEKILDLLTKEQAIVPALWHLEVMNVLQMAQRKNRINKEQIPLILEKLGQLNIETDKAAININAIDFMQFVQKYDITSYDGIYLEISKREKLPIATLDKKMKSVANELGLYLKI
ncbi:Death on curing protein, Doc toxin [uncultured Candidatus Thioglobus sp.]|nr:Death on curing protein, Doc toxin [uncultured Candidatus Thioglobus sp.]